MDVQEAQSVVPLVKSTLYGLLVRPWSGGQPEAVIHHKKNQVSVMFPQLLCRKFKETYFSVDCNPQIAWQQTRPMPRETRANASTRRSAYCCPFFFFEEIVEKSKGKEGNPGKKREKPDIFKVLGDNDARSLQKAQENRSERGPIRDMLNAKQDRRSSERRPPSHLFYPPVRSWHPWEWIWDHVRFVLSASYLVHPLAWSETHRRDASAQTDGLSFVVTRWKLERRELSFHPLEGIELGAMMANTNTNTDKLAGLHRVRKTGSIPPKMRQENLTPEPGRMGCGSMDKKRRKVRSQGLRSQGPGC